MNSKPKVTVVTVCYNCCPVIERTLQNVLKQTYDRLEYIVIDGGSTDGTRDIVARYADRLAYWSSESDAGIYDAMNKGIRRATGDWIIFRNAGDYFFRSTTIEEVFRWYDDQGEALIVGGTRNFGARGYRDAFYHRQQEDVWHRAFLPHPSTFIRLSVQQAHPYATCYRISSDYAFFLTILLGGATLTCYDGLVSLFDCEEGISSRRLAEGWKEILHIRRQLGAPTAVIRVTEKRLRFVRITAFVHRLLALLNKRLYSAYRHRHHEAGWTQQPMEVTLKDA